LAPVTPDLATLFGGFPLDDLQSDLGHLANHHRHAWLDDARLFRGDLFEALPQDRRVVEPDADDDAAPRGDDVRGIETAPDAHLERNPLALQPLVEQQSESRLEFKLAY